VNIRIQNVSVEYQRPILSDIDLDIEAGEFVSIVGQTGCGKSTLLRLILGEQTPTRGRVFVGGKERTQPDPTCGYVPQKYSLFPDRTVLGNVTFGLKGRDARREALRMLRRTGLQESDAGKYPHQLSGGMQQRVAIAQALVMNPPVLLMDEAFSALDPGTRAGMQNLIKELWRESGTTIVFVTHNTREAVYLGTRVIALANRSIAMDVSAATEEELEHVFL
jgi:NitT/TauT family transport system ATP-binding protein